MLAVAAGLVIVSVLITAGIAVLTASRAAGTGALVGGAIVVSFFVVGSGVVAIATRSAPQTALLVALLTYTLQVAVVALVFAALVSSGELGTSLSREWLAGGVVVATVVWTASQLIGAARARVPAYDVGLPEPRETGGESVSARSKAGAS